jgi:hypothetical protein
MTSLCPVFQEPQLTDNNEFLAGGLLWFYEAGTSTLSISYSDSAGTVPWPNPIVLNARGACAGTIWLKTGDPYRIVLEGRPIYGQTHGVVITEHDNITGITSSDAPEDWVPFPAAPTFLSTTSFTVTGDYRSIFIPNRKLRITDSGGVSVHSVISSSFALNVTTVTVTGLIDSGISLVEYSFVTPASSPDRFEDVVITDDLTVGDDAVIDGDLTVSGALTINSNPAWTNANNTFGTSVSPSAGFITSANGFRFYREVKDITFVSTGSTVFLSYTDAFSSAFPTACFQVLATLGDFSVSIGQYSPMLSVHNVTVNGFNYDIICRAAVPAGTYNLKLTYLALGY